MNSIIERQYKNMRYQAIVLLGIACFYFLYKFFYVVIQLYILLSVYLAVSATNTSISYNDFMSVKLNSSADVV